MVDCSGNDREGFSASSKKEDLPSGRQYNSMLFYHCGMAFTELQLPYSLVIRQISPIQCNQSKE